MCVFDWDFSDDCFFKKICDFLFPATRSCTILHFLRSSVTSHIILRLCPHNLTRVFFFHFRPIPMLSFLDPSSAFLLHPVLGQAILRPFYILILHMKDAMGFPGFFENDISFSKSGSFSSQFKGAGNGRPPLIRPIFVAPRIFRN